MDKKYNENWIVVIGQGFAFEVTHEVKHVLWMYAPRLLPHTKGEAPSLHTLFSHPPPHTVTWQVLLRHRRARVQGWRAAGRHVTAEGELARVPYKTDAGSGCTWRRHVACARQLRAAAGAASPTRALVAPPLLRRRARVSAASVACPTPVPLRRRIEELISWNCVTKRRGPVRKSRSLAVTYAVTS